MVPPPPRPRLEHRLFSNRCEGLLYDFQKRHVLTIEELRAVIRKMDRLIIDMDGLPPRPPGDTTIPRMVDLQRLREYFQEELSWRPTSIFSKLWMALTQEIRPVSEYDY